MNNDLISREALKRAICIKFYTTPYYKHILDEIDNAPTVEERPQGEWKLVSDINNDIDVVCPFCNERRIISYAHGYSIEEVKLQLQKVNDLPNYCENCGAKTKGGAE